MSTATMTVPAAAAPAPSPAAAPSFTRGLLGFVVSTALVSAVLVLIA